MDVLLLSRLQFALTIMFHYLFPPLTIGMGFVLVFLEAQYLRTKDPIYHTAARFWTRIFGLNFALGVVTGIVMEFEFGTNWAVYSRYVGDVFGSALAAEGIFAFFLESGFLSLLLFGWDRISPAMHFFATLMVCIGGIFSSVWIVVANSWQQTPAGHVIRDHVINGQVFQRAEIVDFWALVFNPSSVNRLVHVWLGSIILGAFFVMSISAWYLLKGRHLEFARRSFAGALLFGTFGSVAQLGSGHFQADGVVHHQPAKLAALEGLYKSEKGAPMYIFGWPDDASQTVKYGLAMPGMLSFVAHGDMNAEVKGLDELEKDWGRPPVWITFQSYHLMVGIGMIFLGATLVSCFFYWRGTLFEQRWLLWFYVFAVALAFIANEAGWVAAETGRQPWIVYPSMINGRIHGGLRTSDALSEAVRAEQVLGSIIFFGVVYSLLGVLWIMLLHQKIQHGPDDHTNPEPHEQSLLEAAAGLAGHGGSMTHAEGSPGG
ncbi:cytochrome ubiquinol oxidase subunit I [Planctomicrobium piriforme]|uniref:Cytochrome d ubiquinol oxidase subunit I n=1 Tax=Planctomicrobium piriforme TaxID=1576369 RepID=A0A1I3K0F9_9PLAN|nr:cytochrome ubiquinol oxidase subunit I [Planctomicrobium piriforme]SFI65972.1 cytochrome d ubiquinol oxidase subunit I [Planctomicrobium piriforme]